MGQAVTDRLVGSVHDLFFRTVHNRSLIYNACWEDPRIDRQVLELDSASRVVMLTSAGCNALDYLLDAPAEIHAIDMNPRQNALLELKLALIRHRPYADLAAMFGAGVHLEYKKVYQAVRSNLSVAAQMFWDEKIHCFDPFDRRGTFYYHGTSGTVAWFLSRYVIAHLKRSIRAQIFALLNAGSLDEQQSIYHAIEPMLWDRFSCWVLRQPALMTLLGVPRTQMQMASEQHSDDLLAYIQTRLRHVFTEVPLHDNYFWRVYLTGCYTPGCCPNYLKPEFQAPLQAHADRIFTHTTTITQFLRRHPGQYTHFLLLDHQDWLAGHDPTALAEEWEQILSNSRCGAKILLRSAAATLDFLPAFVLSALRFFPERTEVPHRQDRVGTYRSLHLAEVL